MAGGAKETPRQKMVGMMYLVLTALLALQVSNSVLEKFYFIDDSLQNSLKISRENAGHLIKGIEKQIEERPSDYNKLVLKKANDVRKLTQDVITEFDAVRKQIVDETGGIEETGNYKGEKGYDDINRILLGPGDGGDGIAYTKLKKLLDDYGAAIDKIDTAVSKELKAFLPLAKDPASDPSIRRADLKAMDWQRVNFQNTPMVATMAVLSNMQNEVAKIESKAVEILASKVGADMMKFDVVQARVTAESNVVAAGTKYKAFLFIAASASNINPKMTSDRGAVKVDPTTKVGEVEFTVSPAGSYDADGRSKASWTGRITVPTPAGTDTTYEVKQEYTIVKPVIDVQAAAVSALYFKCGNELNIQVPALGTAYDPSFSVSDGAKVIKGSKKGEIIVVPNSASVKISVSSGGNAIGSKDFKVRIVPKPDIEVQINKKAINEKTGGPCPRSLSAVAIPDKSFKEFLPKDARYRVTEWSITLARGKRAMGTKNFNGPDANISDLAADAKEGDRLVIEVKKVQRMNFENSLEDVNIGTVIRTFPITQ